MKCFVTFYEIVSDMLAVLFIDITINVLDQMVHN